jgi:hypothetical protein
MTVPEPGYIGARLGLLVEAGDARPRRSVLRVIAVWMLVAPSVLVFAQFLSIFWRGEEGVTPITVFGALMVSVIVAAFVLLGLRVTARYIESRPKDGVGAGGAPARESREDGDA